MILALTSSTYPRFKADWFARKASSANGTLAFCDIDTEVRPQLPRHRRMNEQNRKSSQPRHRGTLLYSADAFRSARWFTMLGCVVAYW